MKRNVLGTAILLTAVAACVWAFATVAKDKPEDKLSTTRTLQGQVLDAADAGIPDAVVYLKNTKTLGVRTFIADKDGNYRFTALSLNIDYQVYAEHHGSKSEIKTVSSFDTRKTVVLNLKIDVKR
ncbi:MAG TPA: carboxypeptidase-like regulatory domain-containing protein [Terriglobales bacterium]|nr:carboxypeptidase-like regulatory domain-containing protein [Terriglobales bacterium]